MRLSLHVRIGLGCLGQIATLDEHEEECYLALTEAKKSFDNERKYSQFLTIGTKLQFLKRSNEQSDFDAQCYDNVALGTSSWRAPPSSPQHLTIDLSDTARVRLIWESPMDYGGRRDVVYSLECRMSPGNRPCPASLVYVPPGRVNQTE
ncbi:unnamed protein product [Protopolystoma xenopodis]|uniref:Fibronectin type-III domain-containing protein n=1 Tax=Protopolystoma xenopodis TaxID=117903 RepID=A0A3S5CVB2_9PLAT|nr:unnamed protein product [Protopolystoma xenopodis]